MVYDLKKACDIRYVYLYHFYFNTFEVTEINKSEHITSDTV